jgi:hypothetical protein
MQIQVKNCPLFPDYFALTFYGREALHTKAMMGRRLVLLRPRWS